MKVKLHHLAGADFNAVRKALWEGKTPGPHKTTELLPDMTDCSYVFAWDPSVESWHRVSTEYFLAAVEHFTLWLPAPPPPEQEQSDDQ